jgi:zinc-binding alcohol dehydrogenase family protein
MKAVAYQQCLPIAHAESLLDVDLPEPAPGPHDLLVEIRAVAANPVDTKMRARAHPAPGHCKVLGWDASGMVRAVGADVTLFQPGDRIWYAGSLQRPGSNSEMHLVDERLAGMAPKSLVFAAAAALPLTTITAWEMLFERLAISPGKHHHDQSILIVGAGGGVGSILTELARRLTGLKVIATASRPETAQWVRELGAHEVIDHMRPLGDELRRVNAQAPNYVVSLTNTAQHYAAITEAIAPQGKVGLIDDLQTRAIDIELLKGKSVSLHWEFMFTRSTFATSDMIAQHNLLNEVAALVDSGVIRTTLGEHLGRISAANMKRAHALVESGKVRGKLVLEGF